MGMVFGKIDVEMPAHKVIRKAEGYEIWRYPASVAATVRASYLNHENPPQGEEFTNQAFRILAKYIGVFTKPENVKSEGEAGERISMTAPVVMGEGEKIAMTAPVVMGESKESATVTDQSMTFLLPSKYKTVEDAPLPINPAVKLEMAPEGRCEAVLQYAGGVRFQMARTKAEELRKLLERDGIVATGPYTVQGYNPPMTLPMFKRTEIHIPVDAAKIDIE